MTVGEYRRVPLEPATTNDPLACCARGARRKDTPGSNVRLHTSSLHSSERRTGAFSYRTVSTVCNIATR